MADGLGDVDGMAPVLDGEEGPAPLKVFISYAHVDDKHRKELVEHLMPLVDTGVLTGRSGRTRSTPTWRSRTSCCCW